MVKLRTIYYLGIYRSELIAERKPQGSSAEDNKMKYIISVLKKLGYHVTVISVLSSDVQGWHKRKICYVDEKETHIYITSYDTNKKYFSKLAALLRLLFLFAYLVGHIQKDGILLAYHTQLFAVPIRTAKSLRRFKLILEVEELFYRDTRNPKDVGRKSMENKLISIADKYLFASNMLQKVVSQGKPSVIVYGGLDIPPKYTNRPEDGNIHIVYAGGIDVLRNVGIAVECMHLLPDNYYLHILGSGYPEAIQKLENQIIEVNSSLNSNRICFYGTLYGKEYDTFLQKCHIGLNMQNIGASIEEVAFPSKITSYLGRGLNVVTGRLISIVNSDLNKHVQYYDETTPECVATAIKLININPYETQIRIISRLNARFTHGFGKMLNNEDA